ncbi:hypothetical protein [Roseivivax sp. CAU 1753]
MRGVAFERESRRHDRHQSPTGRETLCSRDEMFGSDVLVPGAIDRGGEGRIHHHDVGQNQGLQQIIDMFAVVACDLSAENRAQETLTKGVDFIEHKRGTGPGSESSQGTSAGGWFEHGLALADRSRPHGQGGKWQWRGKLLQPDLLLGAAGFRQQLGREEFCGEVIILTAVATQQHLDGRGLHQVIGHAPVPGTAGIAAMKRLAHDARKRRAAQGLVVDLRADLRQRRGEISVGD